MLKNILDVVKEITTAIVDSSIDITEDKKELVIKIITNAINQGLAKESRALSDLLSEANDNNSTLNNFKEVIASSFTKKAGLNPTIANGLISAILPAVLDTFSNTLERDTIIKAFNQEKEKLEIKDSLGAFGRLLY